MEEFLNILPEKHDEAIESVQGLLYVLYYSTDCIFCREAVLNLINMRENSLFSYAVCCVDGAKEFRMKENMLSLPVVRIYENGKLIRHTDGYSRVYGAEYDMRGSIEKSEDFHAVYADNAATTKMSRKALKAYCDCAKDNYGNPSTGYEAGQKAKGTLEHSRDMIKSCLGMKKGRVVFTGGGSEADGLALHSAYKEGLKLGKKHMITSATEHHAVLHTMESFKEDGFEITVLGVDEKGRISPEELEAAIRPDTVLCSIMFANNETGTLQPVKEIGETCRRHGVLFHCDAVQAAGHTDINFDELKIDYLAIAGHKFNGPKGVGALLAAENAPVYPLILGGGQEGGGRAGTENVQGIYAMATALNDHVKHLKKESRTLREATERLAGALLEIPGAVYNGDRENRLPGTVNVSFEGIGGRELLFLLDAKYGICASGGSACNTGNGKPSHVLTAMGLPDELAEAAVRFSLGADEAGEAEYIAGAVKECVAVLGARGSERREKREE